MKNPVLRVYAAAGLHRLFGCLGLSVGFVLLLLQPAAAQLLPFDVRALSSGLAPVVAQTQAPLALNVEFRNVGTNTIWAIDVNYRVGQGPVQRMVHAFPANGTLAPQGGRRTVRHTTPWTPLAPGQYIIKCWGSNLNQIRVDGNPANDTATTVVTVVARAAPRLTVLEVFTSGSCPICGAGAAALEALETRQASRMACLHYQQNFPGNGDYYQTLESVRRRQYYGIQAVPYAVFDGGAPEPANRLSDAEVVLRQAVPCFLEIDAVYTRQTAARTVRVDARLKALGPGTSPHLVLRAAVVEPRVVPSQATNGQAALPHLVRQLLPSATGAAVGPLVAGATFPLTTSWVIPASALNCNLANLVVVVFAQDTVTREIQQAVRARLNGVLAVAPDAPTALDFVLTPNPVLARAEAMASVLLPAPAHVALAVTDALGRTVAAVPARLLPAGRQAFPLALGGVAPGLYLVRVTIDGQTRTRRLVVE